MSLQERSKDLVERLLQPGIDISSLVAENFSARSQVTLSFTGFHGPNEIEACFNLLALALPVRLSLNLLPISPKSLKTGKTASILSSTCPQDSVVAVHVKRAVDLPVPGFSCTFPRKESTFLIKWDREAKYVEEILLRSEAQASQSVILRAVYRSGLLQIAKLSHNPVFVFLCLAIHWLLSLQLSMLVILVSHLLAPFFAPDDTKVRKVRLHGLSATFFAILCSGLSVVYGVAAREREASVNGKERLARSPSSALPILGQSNSTVRRKSVSFAPDDVKAAAALADSPSIRILTRTAANAARRIFSPPPPIRERPPLPTTAPSPLARKTDDDDDVFGPASSLPSLPTETSSVARKQKSSLDRAESSTEAHAISSRAPTLSARAQDFQPQAAKPVALSIPELSITTPSKGTEYKLQTSPTPPGATHPDEQSFQSWSSPSSSFYASTSSHQDPEIQPIMHSFHPPIDTHPSNISITDHNSVSQSTMPQVSSTTASFVTLPPVRMSKAIPIRRPTVVKAAPEPASASVEIVDPLQDVVAAPVVEPLVSKPEPKDISSSPVVEKTTTTPAWSDETEEEKANQTFNADNSGDALLLSDQDSPESVQRWFTAMDQKRDKAREASISPIASPTASPQSDRTPLPKESPTESMTPELSPYARPPASLPSVSLPWREPLEESQPIQLGWDDEEEPATIVPDHDAWDEKPSTRSSSSTSLASPASPPIRLEPDVQTSWDAPPLRSSSHAGLDEDDEEVSDSIQPLVRKHRKDKRASADPWDKQANRKQSRQKLNGVWAQQHATESSNRSDSPTSSASSNGVWSTAPPSRRSQRASRGRGQNVWSARGRGGTLWTPGTQRPAPAPPIDIKYTEPIVTNHDDWETERPFISPSAYAARVRNDQQRKDNSIPGLPAYHDARD